MMPADLLDDFWPCRWVRASGNGSWTPCGEAPGAIWAHCLPVAGYGSDALSDVLAWPWDRPGTWWRRTGRAGWLGDHLLDEPPTGESVLVVETPADWLAQRQEAVCILDWSLDLAAIFHDAPDLVCSTKRLADRLIAALQHRAAVRIVSP